jgi:hypothetical protein
MKFLATLGRLLLDYGWFPISPSGDPDREDTR